MQDHLVEYLLGTLDTVTKARVEAEVKANPVTREQLRVLEQAFAPLAEDAADVPAPPPGLVMNTLARIAEHRCALPPAPVATPNQGAVPTRRFFRRVDWLVAACLLVFVGGIAFPLAARQWQAYQRVACANNLRKFWDGLASYSNSHRGQFPQIDRADPAGIFVPILRDAGLAQDVSIGCPARGAQPPLPYSVNDLAALSVRSPQEYRVVSHQLGGHYAYCLGYQEGGELRGLRRDSPGGLPILADCAEDASNSTNHRGPGQNVLYVGGNVRWSTQPNVGLEQDHIFLSRNRKVQAGVQLSDSVLGTSGTTPFAAQ